MRLTGHRATATTTPQTEGKTIRWARLYDLGTTLLSFGRAAALRRRTVELAEIAPGERVLDVGCGPGRLAIASAMVAGPAPGIQITRPRFVLVLRRATSQEEALRLAKELQKDVPTAQAVKTDQGFFVVDSVTPRSQADALLDALQLKSKKKLNPSLLQVPR